MYSLDVSGRLICKMLARSAVSVMLAKAILETTGAFNAPVRTGRVTQTFNLSTWTPTRICRPACRTCSRRATALDARSMVNWRYTASARLLTSKPSGKLPKVCSSDRPANKYTKQLYCVFLSGFIVLVIGALRGRKIDIPVAFRGVRSPSSRPMPRDSIHQRVDVVRKRLPVFVCW